MSEPVWEVRWIRLEKGAGFEDVSDVLANAAAGWEPFAAMQEKGGWILMLKRKAT